MKKQVLAIALAGAMALTMVGCSSGASSSSSSSAASSAASSSSAAQQASTDTYESILADYSAQIEAEAPVLVEEYNTEAASLGSDVQAKAQLSNDKISELAKISTEGTEKMAELMMKKGDDYSVYEDWANQLNDVYMAQSQLITDAYMASAM